MKSAARAAEAWRSAPTPYRAQSSELGVAVTNEREFNWY
jgi:hypothetical protein